MHPMYRQVEDIFERLDRMPEWDGDVRCAERMADHDGFVEPPVPEITWTLFALLHYRKRKRWAMKVLRTNLQCPERVEVRNQAVPGLPEWRYSSRQNNAFIVNRVSGEKIDIDLYRRPEYMYPGSLQRYIKSIKSPTPLKQRLGELFPQGVGMSVAIANLHPCYRVCFGDGSPEDSWFKLHPRIVEEYGSLVEAFLDAWQEPERRIVLALSIGDWAFVKQAAESQGFWELADRAADWAERSRRRWVNMARVAWDNEHDRDALCAMANARADDFFECLKIACKDDLLRDKDVEIVSRHPAWDQRMYEACRALAPPY